MDFQAGETKEIITGLKEGWQNKRRKQSKVNVVLLLMSSIISTEEKR